MCLMVWALAIKTHHFIISHKFQQNKFHIIINQSNLGSKPTTGNIKSTRSRSRKSAMSASSTTKTSPSPSPSSFSFDMSSGFPSKPILKPEQIGFCVQALTFFKSKQHQQNHPHFSLIEQEFSILQDHRMRVSEVNSNCSVAKLHVNCRKNRYSDVVPFDANRVVLDPCKDHRPSAMGYINASYITAEANPSESVSRFIATQGPLTETFEDFWEMVLQNHCPAVVMLTKLVDHHRIQKCGDYFQAENGPRLFGDISTVTKNITTTDSSLVLRHLEVNRQESEDPPLPVLHIQYPEWPDHGVPYDTLAVREIFRRLCHQPSCGALQALVEPEHIVQFITPFKEFYAKSIIVRNHNSTVYYKQHVGNANNRKSEHSCF